jgi:hypothetical protein
MQNGRIRTSIPVEIRASGRVAQGTVRNASDGGMFVETRTIPPQGETVSLRFPPRAGATIVVNGLVWWTTEGSRRAHRRQGFGLRLLEDDERYSKMLAGMRPDASRTRLIAALQRKTLGAAGEAPRDSGKSRRSR